MAKIKIDTYFAICIGFFLLFKEVFFTPTSFQIQIILLDLDPNKQFNHPIVSTISNLWTVQKMTIFELFYIFASSFNVFVKGYS